MTMHLLRGYSSLNTKKPKSKITKTKMAQLESEWRAHNKACRQNHLHDCQYKTLDEYIDYAYGKVKLKKEFKTYETANKTYTRNTPNYPSADRSTSRNNASQSTTNPTPRREPQKYTGTLVKGISTLHKSNAVPIIDEQEAKDHAAMRR